MSFAQSRQGLRAAVFETLGEPAFIDDATAPVRVRVIERDQSLQFGDSLANVASVRIEVPTDLTVSRGTRITLQGDGRVFIVNSSPILVRSGVHSVSVGAAR